MDDLHFLFSFCKAKFLNLCKKLTYQTQNFLTKSILKLRWGRKENYHCCYIYIPKFWTKMKPWVFHLKEALIHTCHACVQRGLTSLKYML